MVERLTVRHLVRLSLFRSLILYRIRHAPVLMTRVCRPEHIGGHRAARISVFTSVFRHAHCMSRRPAFLRYSAPCSMGYLSKKTEQLHLLRIEAFGSVPAL